MNTELQQREPVVITISYGGGVVFNVLREGLDFTADILTNPIAGADFDIMMNRNMERAIERAREEIK